MFVTLLSLNTPLIRTFMSIDFVPYSSRPHVSLLREELVMNNVIHIFFLWLFVYIPSGVHARNNVLYCIVVGFRRLMPPDALQPKAYSTNPGL